MDDMGSNKTAALSGKADHTIQIGTGLLELGSETAISTQLYNNQFPGPLLRLQEGKQVTIEIRNNTDTPEQLHWHGQTLPDNVDGAAEEGTPYIPPHSINRVTFTPGPSALHHKTYPLRMILSALTDYDIGFENGLLKCNKALTD